MNKATIRIPTSLVDQLQAFLDGKGDGGCNVIHTFTADLGGGIEADIKVVDGDGPYVDPVLFHDGCEVTAGEVTDSLLGEYNFDYDGQTYVVAVERESHASA